MPTGEDHQGISQQGSLIVLPQGLLHVLIDVVHLSIQDVSRYSLSLWACSLQLLKKALISSQLSMLRVHSLHVKNVVIDAAGMYVQMQLPALVVNTL